MTNCTPYQYIIISVWSAVGIYLVGSTLRQTCNLSRASPLYYVLCLKIIDTFVVWFELFFIYINFWLKDLKSMIWTLHQLFCMIRFSYDVYIMFFLFLIKIILLFYFKYFILSLYCRINLHWSSIMNLLVPFALGDVQTWICIYTAFLPFLSPLWPYFGNLEWDWQSWFGLDLWKLVSIIYLFYFSKEVSFQTKWSSFYYYKYTSL